MSVRTPIILCMLLTMASTAVGLMVANRIKSFKPNYVIQTRLFSAANDAVPTNILCDIISSSADAPQCKVDEAKDFGSVLKGYKKCVLFAVPGAFTPTCSVSHLPGFITSASAMKAKGVEAIFCLSVNDRFVMKSWGDATAGFAASGVQLVADGNGEFTKAVGQVKDATGGRMGLRSMRYAMIIENGVITSVNVDEKGLDKSSAETIMSLL